MHSNTTRRSSSFRSLALALLALVATVSCGRDATHDGHSHGKESTEPEPVSITKWTEKHELFVEFPPPVAGKTVEYHAHVTALEGFRALTAGRFRVRWKTPSGVAAETQIDGVKRAGIFTPSGPAPSPGSYELEMSVEHDGATDVFDCGPIVIGDAAKAPAEEAPSAAITFLKESQWKIPFGTDWATERSLAKEVELPATVEPAGTDQLVIGSPTGGRFFHNPKLALAEGSRIRKGDVVGSIAPTVAGEDYSRLQLAVDEARISKDQVEREIKRVEPMVKEGLLPEKRLTELRNERDTLSARLSAAKGRIGRVLAPGGTGGLPIRSSIEGIVSQVLVPNGEPVDAGAALVRIGGTSSVWVRTRFVARPAAAFTGAAPAAVRLPSGARIDVGSAGARLLSAAPVIDPTSRIATWVLEVPPQAGERPLQPGMQVVLLLRVGAPRTVLSVPKSAVVEINTRPFVFVQVDGEHFEKRNVTLGDSDGGFVELTSGIAKGERIVTTGGFDVHLGSLMGSVESHRH
ncbi:MAG: efflux RND transporter periplasmic adaptor subunit [Myxococcales bacterium]|nr:efflux RND transporter periplasmic adaptor subunit [Myxococcales bacterium]